MNTTCSDVQHSLDSGLSLTPSEKEHIKQCKECLRLHDAFNTIDRVYLKPEQETTTHFARVMVAQVKEVVLNKKRRIKRMISVSALGATCCLALIITRQEDGEYRKVRSPLSKGGNTQISADALSSEVTGNNENDKSFIGSASAPQAISRGVENKAAAVEYNDENVDKLEPQFERALNKSLVENVPERSAAELHIQKDSFIDDQLPLKDNLIKSKNGRFKSAAPMPLSVGRRDYKKSIPPSLPSEYIDANGYWENTYLPGSPATPLLIESLFTSFFRHIQHKHHVDTSSIFTVQNFVEPPEHGALALAVHTDPLFIEKPQRVRLQVTIRGADRAKGSRPPLTIVIVIPNFSRASLHDREMIQELLKTVEAQKRVDDHVTILTDDNALPFADFRLGTLTLFGKNRKLGDSSMLCNTLCLYSKATAMAFADDKKQLRERIILTIGHASIGSLVSATKSIESHVLQGGIGSVITSNDSLELMRLSSKGQGSYRLIHGAAQSIEKVITAELESYGSVVARALRLNIQLKSNVRLKEIIGSKKLTILEAKHEKEVELANDKRIAQSLGISADRGADDPGIQILIPRFLSGDAHIIILDIFVPQAGPIADVSLKLKDLVRMKNETLQTSSSLPAYRPESTEDTFNIYRNETAQRLASTIRTVRDLAKSGNFRQGISLLRAFGETLGQQAPAGVEKDNTIKLIKTYMSIMEEMQALDNQGNSQQVREAISGSLELANRNILGNARKEK